MKGSGQNNNLVFVIEYEKKLHKFEFKIEGLDINELIAD